jgi:hypothetical protein
MYNKWVGSFSVLRPRIYELCFVFGVTAAWQSVSVAREVSSLEDAIRLKGFGAQLVEEADAEKVRLSDVDQVKAIKAAWEKQKQEALLQYQTEKARQANVVGEQGMDYQIHLNEELASLQTEETFRREYVNEREQRRRQERREINLTEATEYSLLENEPRVDWKLRKFAETTHSSVTSSGSGGNQSWEAPPPPPPPPAYEPPVYEEMMPPPPPPPPLFEEENPF